VAPGFSPLDEAVDLGPGTLSPRLVEAVVRLGTWVPFAQAPALLAFFMGVRISEETVRRLTEAAGAALVALEEAAVEELVATRPPPPSGPAVQQLSVDGAMVPLVGGEWAEVKTLALGTVQTRPSADGTLQPTTTDLSYFSRLTDAAAFGWAATLETYRRGVDTAGVVCAVLDGAVWLQGFVDLHRPDAVRILDFAHAVEHLTAAAQAVYGAGTADARTWLSAQAHELAHGDPDQVLAALASLPVAQAAVPAEAATTCAGVLAYLTSRRAQIAYAAFQAAGYPIGSGCVESANKLVVEARLKGSGMHWARANVNPMVALRAVACSGRWQALWPPIARHLLDLARARRRQRHHRRRAARRIPCTPPSRPPRPPRTANGRPTAHHPWKRPILAGGHRHNRLHAKL
jgi:hypothetical protein